MTDKIFQHANFLNAHPMQERLNKIWLEHLKTQKTPLPQMVEQPFMTERPRIEDRKAAFNISTRPIKEQE